MSEKMKYKHIIYFINGDTLIMDSDSKELAFSSLGGFAYLRIIDGITLTTIPATSILRITSKEN